MPAGRRVIYIKNPRDGGSHFRTMNGGSGNPKAKTSPPKKPKTSTSTNTMGGIHGYLPGYKTPSNWQHMGNNPKPTAPKPAPILPTSYYGVGPYDTSFLQPPDRDPYGTRPLTTEEILASAGILAGLFATVLTPAMLTEAGAIESGAYLSGDVQLLGATIHSGAQTSMITLSPAQAAMVSNGGLGGSLTLGGLGLAGVPMGVNDSPITEWDRNKGAYVTHYADLMTWLQRNPEGNPIQPPEDWMPSLSQGLGW